MNSKTYKSHEFKLDGIIVRWVSNNAVPPTDCLNDMLKQGLITSVEHSASETVRTEETMAFIQEYRKNHSAPASEEERAEMRAAFGEGAKVVNAITGRVTYL